MEGLLTAAGPGIMGTTGTPATGAATGIMGAAAGMGTITGIHTGDGGLWDGRSSTGGRGDILITGIRMDILIVAGIMDIVRGRVLTIILKIMNVMDIVRTLDIESMLFPGTPFYCSLKIFPFTGVWGPGAGELIEIKPDQVLEASIFKTLQVIFSLLP